MTAGLEENFAVCLGNPVVVSLYAVDRGPQAGKAPKAKPLKVHVLRCRSQTCGGLLAFEETDGGFLLGQAILLADEDEGKRFFPCPKCGGRNLVQEKNFAGKLRTCVYGFEAAT